MKRIYFLVITILSFGVTRGQEKLEGNWEGKLVVGNNAIRLVFHLKKDSSGFSGSMDSPDQGAKNIPLSKVEFRNDSLLLEIATIGGKASGKFLNDSTFNGRWTQGMSFPLSLKKVSIPAVVSRPQTPKPPFPYQSEDVVYFNKDKTIQYGATISVPKGEGPFPALILITGSGQQNRDEELVGHKPFAVIADYLVRQGYVVLRFDDRGVGQTTGNADSATSKHFAEDVNVGLDYLLSRNEIAKNKIGMLGHSEGGMIAQIVAAERQDVAFVVSLAGPGQKIKDLMIHQSRAMLLAGGVSTEDVENYLKLYKLLLPVVVTAPSDSMAKLAGAAVFSRWMANTPRETVIKTTGVSNENEIGRFVHMFATRLRSPWFKYFFNYDPAPYIHKMKAMTLVLNGEKDVQVLSQPNLDGWRAALAKSGVKKYDIIELKGLNHLFQHCNSCSVLEYGQLEETIAPEALDAMGTWLKTNVK